MCSAQPTCSTYESTRANKIRTTTWALSPRASVCEDAEEFSNREERAERRLEPSARANCPATAHTPTAAKLQWRAPQRDGSNESPKRVTTYLLESSSWACVGGRPVGGERRRRALGQRARGTGARLTTRSDWDGEAVRNILFLAPSVTCISLSLSLCCSLAYLTTCTLGPPPPTSLETSSSVTWRSVLQFVFLCPPPFVYPLNSQI